MHASHGYCLFFILTFHADTQTACAHTESQCTHSHFSLYPSKFVSHKQTANTLYLTHISNHHLPNRGIFLNRVEHVTRLLLNLADIVISVHIVHFLKAFQGRVSVYLGLVGEEVAELATHEGVSGHNTGG